MHIARTAILGKHIVPQISIPKAPVTTYIHFPTIKPRYRTHDVINADQYFGFKNRRIQQIEPIPTEHHEKWLDDIFNSNKEYFALCVIENGEIGARVTKDLMWADYTPHNGVEKAMKEFVGNAKTNFGTFFCRTDEARRIVYTGFVLDVFNRWCRDNNPKEHDFLTKEQYNRLKKICETRSYASNRIMHMLQKELDKNYSKHAESISKGIPVTLLTSIDKLTCKDMENFVKEKNPAFGKYTFREFSDGMCEIQFQIA